MLDTSHVCWNLLDFAIDFVVLVVNKLPTDFTGPYYLLLHMESY